MKAIAATAVLAMAAGVAIGYYLRSGDRREVSDGLAPRPKAKAIADHGGKAAVASLRARVAELERRLSEASGQAVTVAVAAAAGPQPGPGAFRPRSMRENLERLRREDPERYVGVTNFMARSRAARIARDRSRREFFADIGTSGMTADERGAHEKLQQMLRRSEEYETVLQQEDLTDEQREETFRQYRENMREIRRLNAVERDTLLRQMTDDLGFAGEAAAEVIETIKDVFEATDSRHGPHGPPPDGRPRHRGGSPEGKE